MLTNRVDVIVAGHICLDIIPNLEPEHVSAPKLFIPGGLVQVGRATLSLGGSVANTGIALHRLGASIQLVCKVGDDLLGRIVLDSLREHDMSFTQHIVVAPGEATSYSIVLSLPGVDRCFLHCPGANETFAASDLNLSACMDTRILHFGYPPLMPKILADNGRGLAAVFARAQAAGALTSLDMAMPAANSTMLSSGWRSWLREVLPHVDLFLPSFDEISQMLEPSQRNDVTGVLGSDNGTAQLRNISDELLEFGTPIVVLKLGSQGLYLRTSDQVSILSGRKHWHDFNWRPWQNRELFAPCFDVEAVSATGAGDCTIAGFLMGLIQGLGPGENLRSATAVGAHSVQSADATSKIPSWSKIQNCLSSPWSQRTPGIPMTEWRACQDQGIYHGSADAHLNVGLD